MTLPLPEPSARTGYAHNPLDRLAERRDDSDFIAALLEAPDTRLYVLGRDRPVLKLAESGHDPLFTLEEARGLGPSKEIALLGRDEERAYFALQLADEAVVARETADDGAFVDTREFIVTRRPDLLLKDLRAVTMEGLLSPERTGALGHAKSLLGWHARHRFCSACGAPTQAAAAGYRRECANCRTLHFPRTDPVVIMLAVAGDECLLGRQPRFNRGMYSALAGFLEAGETIEEAVRREIREESGVRIGRVAYHASQPWPFPSSIMIGCYAEAVSKDVVIDHAELEDCRWFGRAEVAAMLERRHPEGLLAPNPAAIAHHLLVAWSRRESTVF